MRVKKQIALLLSGAILAGSLAGCDRTIIEHQFHTDTVTDVEYIIENTGTNLVGVQNLHRYFLDHEVRMTMLCYPTTEPEAMDVSELFKTVGIDNTPKLEEASEFLKTQGNMLFYITKCDKDPASRWTAYSKAANMFYDLFMQVEDESSWAENIIANHHAALVGLVCKLEDEYYMLTYVRNDFSR